MHVAMVMTSEQSTGTCPVIMSRRLHGLLLRVFWTFCSSFFFSQSNCVLYFHVSLCVMVDVPQIESSVLSPELDLIYMYFICTYMYIILYSTEELLTEGYVPSLQFC